MALPTTTIKNAANQDVTVNTPVSGRQAAADSQGVVLATEDLAAIGATNSAAAADETVTTGLNGLLKALVRDVRARLPTSLVNNRVRVTIQDAANAELGVTANPIFTRVNTSGGADAIGAGATGVALPTGGTGMFGWLSGIYSRLAPPLATYADNYARVVASNNITRPANVTPYTSGQIVGVAGGGATGRFAFAGLARANGGVVRIDRARLYKSQANALGTFILYIYSGDPQSVGIADQATASSQTVVGNASASPRLVGRIAFDMTGGTVGSDGAEVGGLPVTGSAILVATAAGETNLYGVLVTTGNYTPVSGEAFSVIIEGYAF